MKEIERNIMPKKYKPTKNFKKDIEIMRVFWSKVAKKNGWYVEPFYVQVWIDLDNDKVVDAVSFQGIEQDILCEHEPDDDESSWGCSI